MMIVKNRGSTYSWQVYHHKNTSAPETDYLTFNSTAATDDYADYWNDTAPTSSVYTVGSAADINGSSDTYVTYLWTGIQGFSKFGSYTGNGNADGPFIYTGFRPAFILRKESSNADVWIINDTKRNPINDGSMDPLYPAADSAEPGGVNFDILSNGFKIRNTDGDTNTSGATFIYAAFAEAPFVNSNGVPCNAR
jgi:hypothetical protein